jgi:hypothetical protein
VSVYHLPERSEGSDTHEHTNQLEIQHQNSIMSNVSDIIDSVIHSGFMTSIDVYRVLGDDPDARRYILDYHLDEELEEYLMSKAIEAALSSSPDKPPY